MRLLAACRQPIEIERNQRIAGRDFLALVHMRREAFAAQRNRVEPDMHQDFRAIGGTQGDGVAARHAAGSLRHRRAR